MIDIFMDFNEYTSSLGGAIFTLILVSLIMFWLIRRSKRKKFLW